jgi:hypothetical protein
MIQLKKLWFEDGQIFLQTEAGKVGKLPLKSFRRLYNATDEQRKRFELSPFGIHWPELDEDLNFEGFFYQNNR